MSKKDELLAEGNSEQVAGVEYHDLNEQEKAQLQALVELVQQARLAQDIIYSNLVQAVAVRHGLQNKTIDIDMADIVKNGAANAKLRAVEAPKEAATNEDTN